MNLSICCTHEAQCGEFFRLSFLLSVVPQAFVATDAADPDLGRRVGNRRYVRMAVDALASAVDAGLELLLVHEQRARFSVRPLDRKPLRAMTRQAHFAGYFRGRSARPADRPRRRRRPLAPLQGWRSRPRPEWRARETPRVAKGGRSEPSPTGCAKRSTARSPPCPPPVAMSPPSMTSRRDEAHCE